MGEPCLGTDFFSSSFLVSFFSFYSLSIEPTVAANILAALKKLRKQTVESASRVVLERFLLQAEYVLTHSTFIGVQRDGWIKAGIGPLDVDKLLGHWDHWNDGTLTLAEKKKCREVTVENLVPLLRTSGDCTDAEVVALLPDVPGIFVRPKIEQQHICNRSASIPFNQAFTEKEQARKLASDEAARVAVANKKVREENRAENRRTRKVVLTQRVCCQHLLLHSLPPPVLYFFIMFAQLRILFITIKQIKEYSPCSYPKHKFLTVRVPFHKFLFTFVL
jgi:hypothetical protein